MPLPTAGRAPISSGDRHNVKSFLTALAAPTLLVVTCASSTAALAQAGYPSKPISFVLPYSPGGSGDKFGRVLGQYMSAKLGQPVVIDYKPGGGTNIGIEAVARSKPDGYTLLLAGTPFTVNPFIFKKLNYKIDDLVPISMVSISPYLVVVNPNLPVKNLREFVAYAKQNPTKVNYASAGSGSGAHLGATMLNQMAGINMNHIPYKSATQAITDLIGGDVQLHLSPLIVGAGLVDAGKLRALGVTSLIRSKSFPHVPTIAESGYPGYEVLGWYGVMAAKGTPPEIVRRLNEVIVQGLKDPEVVKSLEVDGIELVPGKPEEFGEFLKRSAAGNAELVKKAGLTVD